VDNYEEMVKKDLGTFNPTVHVADEHGDPARKEDGSIKLKTNWKDVAVDRQGRKYNKHVHGDKQVLDSAGYLKVKRRDTKAGIRKTGRSEAFVAKFREAGYAYYIANDDGGRIEQMIENDWEPVLDKDGPASIKVGLH